VGDLSRVKRQGGGAGCCTSMFDTHVFVVLVVVVRTIILTLDTHFETCRRLVSCFSGRLGPQKTFRFWGVHQRIFFVDNSRGGELIGCEKETFMHGNGARRHIVAVGEQPCISPPMPNAPKREERGRSMIRPRQRRQVRGIGIAEKGKGRLCVPQIQFEDLEKKSSMERDR